MKHLRSESNIECLLCDRVFLVPFIRNHIKSARCIFGGCITIPVSHEGKPQFKAPKTAFLRVHHLVSLRASALKSVSHKKSVLLNTVLQLFVNLS